MPIGKTVELWAICDGCEAMLSCEPNCRGTVRDMIGGVRARGWMVKRTGECLCPDCRERRYLREEREAIQKECDP